MPEEKLVSVITPALNAALLIEHTIRSVQAQTYKSWEMLIVDDCSEDNTCQIVEQFAKGDSRICLIRHHQNMGPAASRNTAIKAAKGRYIAILDSDDMWLPNKIEKQVNFMEANPAVVVMGTAARLIYSNGTQRVRYRPLDTMSIRKNIIKICPFTHSSVMIRKGVFDKVGLYDVAKDGAKETLVEDYDLWVRILAAGCEMANTAEVLMICHRNPRSVMRGHSFWKRLKQRILSRKNAIKTLNLPFASYFNLIPVIVLNIASHYGLKLDFFFKILSKLQGRRIK